MKLLLKIAFDGAGFHGSQAQPSQRTVQGTLTEEFSRLIGTRVNVTGCSRTDAGVHAEGYVVSVEPAEASEDWLKIPPSKFHLAANNILPGDISVLGAFIIEDDLFHPRYSVVKKEYVYRISDSVSRSPFLRGRAYEYGRALSDEAIKKMHTSAGHFVGRHDFTSFMASGSGITDACRTVCTSRVARAPSGLVEFSVSADGFLYNMVRIMAGTLIEVADGRLVPEEIPGIIAGRERRLAGPTLPPDGLYLREVTYPFPITWLAD